MPSFQAINFPSIAGMVEAKWAPVVLCPILDSVERLVVAVAAVSKDSFHLEPANALSRLRCLYGSQADTAIFAAEVSLQELRADLARRGLKALTDHQPAFSGIVIGDLREGEGSDVSEIARSWMAALSSLYDAAKAKAELHPIVHELDARDDDVVPSGSGDRLATLVLEYVVRSRPGLQDFFDGEIRERRPRRRRSKVHSVNIDFAGSHIVANFGTLMASQRATSVDRIKRRMFDLIVDRDREHGTIGHRSHEMLVHHPSQDDPQVSERQLTDIHETLDDLSYQARAEALIFYKMTKVEDIGNHIIEREARIAEQ